MGYKRILALILAILLVSVATTAQAQEMPAFETTEVAEGLYSFGNGFVYNAFLVTDEGVIVFDSVDANHAQHSLDAIRGITDLPIQYLVYSHNHYDHESGGQIFKDAGATVLSHEEVAVWLEAHPNPNVVMPDETWSGDSHTLTSGGRDVILHFYGSNHGKGMTVFEFPDVRTIFTVDLVVPERVAFIYMPDF
ncbi:MAG: MBL fold metallo-hydrolase, partial [Chloroflexi bacterium]|nr:MBL fold metallo-hydrolase [Chloroflexota bacterium]